MNKQSTREIFDNISLNAISFLENHIGINDVEFIERSGKYIHINCRQFGFSTCPFIISTYSFPAYRCDRDVNYKVGRREYTISTARRLQGLPSNFRWALANLEDQEKRLEYSSRMHAFE